MLAVVWVDLAFLGLGLGVWGCIGQNLLGFDSFGVLFGVYWRFGDLVFGFYFCPFGWFGCFGVVWELVLCCCGFGDLRD